MIIIMVKILLSFFLFFLHFANVLSYVKLTTFQWKLIKTILSNPSVSNEMKFKTQKIIFNHYSNWAISKSYHCIEKYKFCKNINPKELNMYALLGLEKAILTYNTSYPFFKHANNYVDYCLYDGISELQPINIIPKYLRKNKKWRNKNSDIYKQSLYTQFIGFDEWIMDKHNDNQNNELLEFNHYNKKEVFEFIENMSYLSKAIIKYKYGENYGYSNKKIAEILGYSEETIRFKHNITKNILINYLKR